MGTGAGDGRPGAGSPFLFVADHEDDLSCGGPDHNVQTHAGHRASTSPAPRARPAASLFYRLA